MGGTRGAVGGWGVGTAQESPAPNVWDTEAGKTCVRGGEVKGGIGMTSGQVNDEKRAKPGRKEHAWGKA